MNCGEEVPRKNRAYIYNEGASWYMNNHVVLRKYNY